jgi:imidazolonepropionase-like amidohydrolase
MKRFLLPLLGLFLAVSPAAQTTPPQGIRDKTPQLKAYTDAKIYLAPDRVVENGTLLIDRGKILAVGADVKIPDGATVVSLRGKTVYPGFVDPYTEYGLAKPKPPRRDRETAPVYDAERIGCNAWNEAIHAERNCIDGFKPDRDAAEEFTRLGFTTVQSVVKDGIFRGRGFVTSLAEGLPNDLVMRPQTWHFLSFDKGTSPQDYPSSLMGAIALIRQTLLDADWYQKAQAAYRLNPNQPKPEINNALAALAGVGSEKLVVEVDDHLNLMRADKIGREFNIEIVPVGDRYAFERVDEIKASGRTLILPLDFPEEPDVSSFESELDVTLGELRRWDWAPSNPALLEKGGVKFALTTHGLNKRETFLDNLRTAVKRGLTKETALSAMTTVPADLCGVSDLVGTIEAGKLADFVVCDGDLFDSETNVIAAVNRGQYFDFIPLDRISFAGYFAGEIGGKSIGLKLTDEGAGAERKIKGQFKADKVEVELDKTEVTFDKLSFTAALDSFGVAGIARFSLRRDHDRLVGKVSYADGRLESWSATVAEEPVDTAVKADDSGEPNEPEGEREIDESEGPISRLTYPNIAFGFETLPQSETVLIQNATIWTSEADGILENADMLVANGKIEAIGTFDFETLDGVKVIDANGKHVTAGIIDEHCHIAISGDVNEGTEAISSETRIGDVIQNDDIAVYRSLAGGVTTVRTAHGSANPIGSQQQTIKLRWGATPEQMKSDDGMPAVKFALGENVKQCNWGEKYRTRYPQSRMGVETFIRDVFVAAREYGEDWDAYRALSRRDQEKTVPPRRNLRLETIDELLKEQRFIDCHSYVQSEILMLMRLAEDFGIRVLNFIHILEGYKIADEMAKHGAMGGSIPDWWAYKFEVYDAIPQGPGVMTEHGVTVSITSDSQHLQRLLNQAAAKSVQYTGMSQEEAWKMVTLNPAKQLKAESQLGSLKVGKDADFVIWSGNPLSIYSTVEQTWIDGAKYFDRETDARIRAEVVQEKNRLIQKILKKPDKKDKRPGMEGEGVPPYEPGVDMEGDGDDYTF